MTERLKISFFSLLFVLSVTGVTVNAQITPSVSAEGHVTAEIIPVFSASETSQLNFGKFSPGPQGGKIVLSPQSTISTIGTIFKGVGSHNAASFLVTGDTDAAFSISLPENPVVLRHTLSSRTMVIEDWISDPSPGTETGMLRDGFSTVFVGATLKVGNLADNPVGIYTGTYSITFDFN